MRKGTMSMRLFVILISLLVSTVKTKLWGGDCEVTKVGKIGTYVEGICYIKCPIKNICKDEHCYRAVMEGKEDLFICILPNNMEDFKEKEVALFPFQINQVLKKKLTFGSKCVTYPEKNADQGAFVNEYCYSTCKDGKCSPDHTCKIVSQKGIKQAEDLGKVNICTNEKNFQENKNLVIKDYDMCYNLEEDAQCSGFDSQGAQFDGGCVEKICYQRCGPTECSGKILKKCYTLDRPKEKLYISYCLDSNDLNKVISVDKESQITEFTQCQHKTGEDSRATFKNKCYFGVNQVEKNKGICVAGSCYYEINSSTEKANALRPRNRICLYGGTNCVHVFVDEPKIAYFRNIHKGQYSIDRSFLIGRI